MMESHRTHRAYPPVQPQVVNEVARDVLPAPGAHPAGGGQLAHVRVHERLARRAVLPASSALLVAAPLDGHAWGRGRRRRMRAMVVIVECKLGLKSLLSKIK